MSRLHERVMSDIERTGRSVIGVFPDADTKDPTNDAFAYSIGNALKGLPELLVIGMCGQDAMWLINFLSEKMIKERRFTDGEIVDLGGAVPVCVVAASVEVKDRYTIQAGQLLGAPYDVMQIVVPDKQGKFPWERGCAAPFSRVKVWRRRTLQ